MRLSELLPDTPVSNPGADPDIAGITEDSRQVQPGWLFVAVPGTQADGHAYVDEAIARGAAAVVVERYLHQPSRVPYAVVPSSRSALAELAARFHGNPAAGMRLIGFTGTFGKTTTSEVLRSLLAAAGHRVGVLGSLGARFHGYADSGSGLTTPSPPALQRILGEMRSHGADSVIMEVTSHAMMLDRIAGLAFSDFVLAAIVPGEHTDFHRSYSDYVAAKARFIDYLAPDAVVAYDADNAAARELASRAPAFIRAGLTVGGRPMPGAFDVTVRNVELDEHGALVTIRGERMRSTLLGMANVRAAGLALTHALARDLDIRTARRVLAALVPLPRRMQRLAIAGRTVLDDAAAHPDSFKSVFEVAALLPRERLVVAHAIRGNRGVDMNRRNALALADLALLHGASQVILTASEDAVGPTDRASAEEIDATRRAFNERACPFAWHDTLAAAMQDVIRSSSADDLVLLTGAQGMTEGAAIMKAAI